MLMEGMFFLEVFTSPEGPGPAPACDTFHKICRFGGVEIGFWQHFIMIMHVFVGGVVSKTALRNSTSLIFT